MDELQKRQIEDRIAALPKGNITLKTINGHVYEYWQYREDNRQVTKRVKGEELAVLKEQIEAREELQKQLRLDSYGNGLGIALLRDGEEFNFETRVVIGDELQTLCKKASGYERRECFKDIKRFLNGDFDSKVCVIYGLRRTGKTIMALQAISELPLEKVAYIKIMTSDKMAMLNRDLRRLQKRGIMYVFVDEVTLMADFVDSASLLSDVYAASGMKLVLSGTDSLGFVLAAGDELYDRAFTIHTTFIPFREYSRLLGYHDVDEYIRYGGTFKAGEVSFEDEASWDEDFSFGDDESTRKYIDTAIARNIQHSLAGYRSGGHFRHLVDLFEAGELTNVINRVIEDMNHSFLLSVLKRDFGSHDLGSARQIDRKRAAKTGEEGILDQIDEERIVEQLRRILDIRNKDDLSVSLTKDHITEIKQYLYLLDLIVNIPSESIASGTGIEHIVFSQPGMRYCQAQALVYSLMKDDSFLAFSASKRKEVIEMILEEVRGRMLEEIVLLETAKTLPKGYRVFKLLFDIGEFDMVVYDEKELKCKIYEIKHSRQIVEKQYKHLLDKKKCEETQFKYGEITDRIVLYNGEDKMVGDIQYTNVVTYLESLKAIR